MSARAALAATLALSLLLPGCAGGKGGGANALVVGKAGDAVKLDPADITDGESAAVTGNIFDNLVQFKSDSTEIEPGLATKWDITKDGLTWTFTLREGVKFHDGTPFDAQAAKFSFDRQRDAKHPHRYGGKFIYWESFFKAVKDVQAKDAKTLVFTLSKPDATFLTNLALFSNGIVSPKAAETHKDNLFKNPVGTGPFKFVSWSQNERIVLEANPDYWGGKPKIDKLFFRPIPDNAARLMELKNGAIQFMDNINPDHVKEMEQDPNLQLVKQPGMNVAYLALNTEHPPLDKKEVRQAIARAINKPAMVQSFFAGGSIGMAAVNPMPPIIWGYNDKVQDHAYDVAAAKALLAKAGLAKGFKLKLFAPNISRPYMPDGMKIGQAIQADLKAVGIDAEIVTYEWGTYLDKAGKGEHDAVLLGWIGDNGDPDNFIYTLLDKDNTVKPSASNYSFYKDEAVHKLLIEARTVTDKAKRTELYLKAQELIHADAPMVPLFHAMQIVATRKNVQGYVLNPTGKRDFKMVSLGAPAESKM